MALSVRTVSSAASVTADPYVVTKPTGTVDDDLLFVIIYLEDATTTCTPPAGWAHAPTPSSLLSNSTGPFRSYCFTKRASGEGASWNFDMSVSAFGCWAALSIQGHVGSGTYIDDVQTAVDTASNTATVAAAVNRTAANDMVIVMTAMFNFVANGFSSGGSVAATEQLDIAGLCIYTGVAAATGTTGTQTLTRSHSSGDTSYTIAVLESSGAAAAPLVFGPAFDAIPFMPPMPTLL